MMVGDVALLLLLSLMLTLTLLLLTNTLLRLITITLKNTTATNYPLLKLLTGRSGQAPLRQ